ncbi:MAG: hypothetical protein ACLUNZ_05710 [Evtepia sp.]
MADAELPDPETVYRKYPTSSPAGCSSGPWSRRPSSPRRSCSSAMSRPRRWT